MISFIKMSYYFYVLLYPGRYLHVLIDAILRPRFFLEKTASSFHDYGLKDLMLKLLTVRFSFPFYHMIARPIPYPHRLKALDRDLSLTNLRRKMSQSNERLVHVQKGERENYLMNMMTSNREPIVFNHRSTIFSFIWLLWRQPRTA